MSLALVDPSLPRRLSVLPGDKDYDAGAKNLSDRIEVLLDGVELFEVAAWDVDACEIRRNRRDKNHQLILVQGIPVIETLHGRVEVRWKRREGGAA